MNIFKWINNNCKSLKGKQVVITGATGGLGKEICLLLAHLEADICLACRNKKLADKLIYEIKQKYKNVNIDFVELDLSSIKSIKDCITKIKEYNGIDILINNAGIYNVPLKKLELGFNNIFQIIWIINFF